MKRKVMMMGLAMITGLPHAVYAGGGNEDRSQAYSLNAPYMPHYGVEGVDKPLMDHVSVAGLSALAGQGISNTWRLEFTPLPAVSNADTPLTAKEIRAGFSLKLDF
jgi:nitrogen fixation protein